MNKIRVMHVLTDTNIGGAGVLLKYFLEAADRETFDYSVVLPSGAALKPYITALDIPVYEVQGIADRSRAPAAKRELIRLFRSTKPTIVHTHSSMTARLAAVRAKVPAIMMTKHCSDRLPRGSFGAFAQKMLGKFAFGALDIAIATDDTAADVLLDAGLPEESIQIIYNGVPKLRDVTRSESDRLRIRIGVPSDAFVVGCFARLEPAKAHEVLLAAARLLLPAYPNMYFLIVGDGSRSEELRKLAGSLGISDHIKFCGFARDIAPFMSLCDLNVNTSVGNETSNLALLEGMSRGVVPIVSGLGGNARIAEYCGRVFPERDERALAMHISSLYNNREERMRLSRAAEVKWKNEYTSERMAADVERLYYETVNMYRK